MDLAVQHRTKLGKNVKALRNEGLIPAQLYGHGIENINLTVDAKEFRKLFKEAGENTIINLVVDGKKHPTLIHDVQRDYLHDTVSHIDFYEVRMDEKIHAPIPVVITGEAPAVKAFGGIVNTTMEEIEVEALPKDLPQRFTVDISSLAELNQSIYVRDIEVPAGVKLLVDPENVIITVTPPMKEEVIEAPVVDVTAVKVETEEKKEERAAARSSEEEAK